MAGMAKMSASGHEAWFDLSRIRPTADRPESDPALNQVKAILRSQSGLFLTNAAALYSPNAAAQAAIIRPGNNPKRIIAAPLIVRPT